MFTIRATQTPPQFHIFCNPLSVQNPYLRFFQNFGTQNPVKFNFAIPRLFCYKFFLRTVVEGIRAARYIYTQRRKLESQRPHNPPGVSAQPSMRGRGEKNDRPRGNKQTQQPSARKPDTATAEAAASSPAPANQTPRQPKQPPAAQRLRSSPAPPKQPKQPPKQPKQPPKQPSASEAAARRAPEVKSAPGAGDRAE